MLYERDGAVATLTLNRPERLNAIVPELIDDLEAALDRAEEDAEVRVIRLARRRPRVLRRLRHRVGRAGDGGRPASRGIRSPTTG